MEFNFPIIFEIWCDGFIESVLGKVHHIDPLTRVLRMKDPQDDKHKIDFYDVVKVNILY
ncbi:YolD-like family protein [Bacillus sp. UNC438CL73TsuS30]|uniref:YolD-like family protein n=1 Tax=Bacillus sp. UNC438CL73TsuS30 TaxID=1340434 RepID=UPI0009E0856C